MKDNATEKKILRAAEEEFMREGYAGARTTSIARNAGVTHAMLHYYFQSKDLLYNRIMDEKIELFEDAIMFKLSDEKLPIKDRIILGAINHFDFLCENPDLPRFFMNEFTLHPELIDRVRDAFVKYLPVTFNMQQELDLAAARGEICPANAGTLMADIILLNIITFFITPIMVSAGLGNTEDLQNARKAENIEIIKKRLAV
ncbi:MAG: TetR/AcrR family transcriptional regulator [Paludibacteraceae bacterium]|nr:TetR/AcrR family transcriptional regulator [Paludibacteraceae bacterium]